MKLAKPNSATVNPNFGEVDENDIRFKRRVYHMVDDAYDFNGNAETDVSSISNWDELWAGMDVDFIEARKAIKALVEATGYPNLGDDDKKVALRWFVAGPGNTYVDALYTQAEHDMYFDLFKENIDIARKERDLKLSRYLMKKSFQGAVSQADVERLILDSRELRDSWIRDGFSGSGYGDISAGVFNFLMNDGDFAAQPIVVVNTALDYFEIDGDYLRYLKKGGSVQIIASTGNDGFYTIERVEFKPNNKTRITTVESITDATADGSAYIIGMQAYSFYSQTLRDDIFQIYNEGIMP